VNTFALTSGNDQLNLSGTQVSNMVLRFDGGAGDDYIIGSSGNDVFIGGVGTDILDGQGGDDTFVLAGNDGSVDQYLGRAGYDTIQGGSGDDTLRVSYYNADYTVEAIDGGAGVNTFALTSGNDQLNLSGTQVSNMVLRFDGGAGDDYIIGSSGNDVIIGGVGTDFLNGAAGDDLLDGGTGSDSMSGGAGNDTYVVDSTGDAVTENAGAGNDTVQSSIAYILGVNVENLTLTGGSAINGTGNALNNVLKGNSGNNTLNGAGGSDTYLFDPGFGQDTVSDVDLTGTAVDVIRFGAGIDASDLLVSRNTSNDLFLDVGGAGDGIVLKNWWSGSSNRIERVEFIDGSFLTPAQLEASATMIAGSGGGDQINGSAGNDLLQGAGGNDVLSDASGGNDLLDGGTGDDTLAGGAGSDLLAGGTGNDTLDTGTGRNVIAFNAGGGVDTVSSGAGAENALSMGGGIRYNDLSLSKNGSDLVVNSGASDKVVLKDWYAGKDNVLDLQMILDASNDFDANSSDPLYNKKVQTFDFRGLVSEFDAALIQSPGLTSWAVTNALLQFHLSAADDAALGGDLAYWYGKNGGFTGIGLAAAEEIIGAPGFGSDAQTLRPFSGLQDGFVKLS
jgi:Ca2+-binding RTX toxin-like protein